MNAENEENFNEWWNLVGSRIAPINKEDAEEHAKRVAFRAWAACIDVNNIEDN